MALIFLRPGHGTQLATVAPRPLRRSRWALGGDHAHDHYDSCGLAVVRMRDSRATAGRSYPACFCRDHDQTGRGVLYLDLPHDAVDAEFRGPCVDSVRTRRRG